MAASNNKKPNRKKYLKEYYNYMKLNNYIKKKTKDGNDKDTKSDSK